MLCRKREKTGYTERLKYMHMLENGFSKTFLEQKFGIDRKLLGYFWVRYQSEGLLGLLKKQQFRADCALRLQVVCDIEEYHLTFVDASLKYNVSASQ